VIQAFGVPERVSQSALLCVAQSKSKKDIMFKVFSKSNMGIYEYIIARTLFFDEVFTQALKESIPQIIFLGAGYDSGGIRFDGLNIHSRIIELDMAATQSRKIKYLKKHKIRIPQSLTLATIDFNNQSLE